MTGQGYRHDDRQIALVFSQAIRGLRKRAGLTQAQLAEKIGVGSRTVEKLEAGGTTVRLDVYERFEHWMELQ